MNTLKSGWEYIKCYLKGKTTILEKNKPCCVRKKLQFLSKSSFNIKAYPTSFTIFQKKKIDFETYEYPNSSNLTGLYVRMYVCR